MRQLSRLWSKLAGEVALSTVLKHDLTVALKYCYSCTMYHEKVLRYLEILCGNVRLQVPMCTCKQ